MSVYPNFQNLPWGSSRPCRFNADFTAAQSAGGFVFDGLMVQFTPDLPSSRRSLFLFETVSFVPSVPVADFQSAMTGIPVLNVLLASQAYAPIYPDGIAFAGGVDFLPLRWWFKPVEEPDTLKGRLSGSLSITPELVGYSDITVRAALTGFEVTDQSWIRAFLSGSEWSPGVEEGSARGVSLVPRRAVDAIAERSF